MILDFTTLLSPAILLAGASIGFYYYPHLKIIYKAITWYLLVMLFVEIASWILSLDGNNLIVLLFYSLIELLLFSWLYFRYLYRQKHRLALVISILGALYIIWEILTFEKETRNFQTYAKVADNFVIIVLVLVYLYEKINSYKETRFENFTLNLIILVFFSLNLIFFLPYNFIIKSTGFQFYFWQGILVITVLFYSYLSWLLLMNGHKTKNKKII